MPALTFIMSLILFLLYWYLPVLVLILAYYFIAKSDREVKFDSLRKVLIIYFVILLLVGIVWLVIKRSGLIFG
jgi:hypothetical protein